MRAGFLAVIALAVDLALPTAQAASSDDALRSELKQLAGRLERLERWNAELEARLKKRVGDAAPVGIALGASHSSSEFSRGSASIVDAAGNPVFGFTAQGYEQLAEIYYRLRVHKNFEISPDLQWIANPAGNPNARPVKVLGVRLQFNQ